MTGQNNKALGFDKNIFWLGITSFFTDIGSEMIVPILPIFLSSVLGVNKAFIGLIEGTAEATASLLKIVSGTVSDIIGRRKEIVVFGYSLSTVAKPFLAISTSGWNVLTVRFMDRLGKGLRTSPRDALIAQSSDRADLGKSFGFHRAMDTAGAILGPAIVFVIFPLLKDNFRIIFLLSAIPSALAVLLLFLFVKETPIIKKTGQDLFSSGIGFDRLLNKKFITFTAVFTLFTIGNSSDAFIILRAQDLKVSLFFIPLLWMMFNFIYTVSSTPGGKLSDIIGRKSVLAFGLLIYSLVYFGFAFAGRTWQVWMLFSVYGIYYGLTDGVSRALIADVIPSEVRATAYGIFNTCVGIAVFVASVLMGILWQVFGVSAAFSLGGALALVSALLLILLL